MLLRFYVCDAELYLFQVLLWTRKFVTQLNLTSTFVLMLVFRYHSNIFSDSLHSLIRVVKDEDFNSSVAPNMSNRVQVVQLITMYSGMKTILQLMGCSLLQITFATRNSLMVP